jgi:hypothetical protein
MRSAAIAAALFALPALADARPITAGASVGRIQSKANSEGEASDTWQIFGRLGLTPRLSAQLEIQKIEDPVDVRGGTALLVVELGNQGGHFIPILLAGFGFDKASTDYYEGSATHIEGGLGLEYRATGGFIIGADLRLGGRSLASTTREVEPGIMPFCGEHPLCGPIGLQEGEYRSGRLYAAIRF